MLQHLMTDFGGLNITHVFWTSAKNDLNTAWLCIKAESQDCSHARISQSLVSAQMGDT